MDEDREINAVDRTNVKKLQLGSGSDLGKIGRDDPSTKLKRKARVLVEVKSVNVFLSWWRAFCCCIFHVM